jgi:hypothetical protein
MGAWSHESFGNDDAMDWIAELEAEGLPAASGALAAIEEIAPEYLEAPICASALAAAEVVAGLRGRPAAQLPQEVRQWIAENPGDPGELAAVAQRAVDAIASKSELRELWEESGEFETWRAAVADLRARLA